MILVCRIQYVTEEFYKYVKAKDVALALDMKDDPTDKVDQIYEYWKLKRKVGISTLLLLCVINHPLFT